MKISVFGIGYVGAVSAACLAENGHDVVAVDIDSTKVNAINAGRATFIEPALEGLINGNVSNGRLSATTDHSEALEQTELSLICVGTPSNDDGALDLRAIESVCTQIGKALKTKTELHTIVIRSTVIPGTLDTVIKPLLEKVSGKKAGEGFLLANNPEFLREGSAVSDFNNPTMIVVGAEEKAAAEKVLSLYENTDAPKTACSPSTAEGLKYVSNAWRANKVSFANEVGNILKAHHVDSHAVMDIFFQDTQINLGQSFLTPGFAFGGSCLPKDIRALKHSAHDKGLQTPLFNSILDANAQQIDRAFQMIETAEPQCVGLIGLSFKAGTDDLRESPLLMLAKAILKGGYQLKIFDPIVSASLWHNAALRQSLEKDIPEIHNCLLDEAHSFANGCDVIVAGHNTDAAREIVNNASQDTTIIDLVRINKHDEHKRYAGICW